MGLKHFFHSTKTDPSDPTIIGATKWNDDHYYVDGAGAPVGNVGALLLAGAAGALTHLNSVAAGMVLTSAGAGALPVWAASGGVGPGTDLTVASLTATGTVTAGGNMITTFNFFWTGPNRSVISSPADGVFKLSNLLETDFNRLQFGGTSNAYPALKRSGTTLQVKLADDSAFAPIAIGNTVSAAAAAPSTHKVAISIGGVSYFLLASNV